MAHGVIELIMREHPLRALLSRILRGPKDGSHIEIVYRHRGAPQDEMKIQVAGIAKIGKGWFMLKDGETQIPFHRVLVVRNPRTSEVLWEKRSS